MDVNKQMCVLFPLLTHQVILVFDFTPIAALTGASGCIRIRLAVAFLTPEINVVLKWSNLIYSLRLIVMSTLVCMKRSPHKHVAFIAGDPVPVNLWSHFGSWRNF